MFREQQISILKWYLKDHVTLTNITFEWYCMQMYVLANHFAFGINFHKCFGIKSLVCLHIILFLQWKAQTDVFLQTEFRFYWLQSKVEEVEGLSEITKINPVSEWNLWTKLNFELKCVVHGLFSLSLQFRFVSLNNISCSTESIQTALAHEYNFTVRTSIIWHATSIK